MKFKVGDRVKVVSGNGRMFAFRMKKYIGTEIIVNELNECNNLWSCTCNDDECWLFDECDLELVGFKKSDLVNEKHGVKYRYGITDWYVNNSFINMDIDNYDENLIRIDGIRDLDVMEVFELVSIYKREEKTEQQLKIEELEKSAKELEEKVTEIREQIEKLNQ